MSQLPKFSARLKEIREAKGMQRRDLAAFAQIKESYLEKIERGYNPPPAEEVIELLVEWQT
ncbi:MAG TPA: helix-turn-helix transcriptional regulator [Abditibacteriaceae bacterium]